MENLIWKLIEFMTVMEFSQTVLLIFILLIMKKNKKLQSHFMAVISDNLIIRDNGYKILLSHVPIMDWQTKYKVDYHFYGHVHSNNHRKHYNLIGTPSYNVGVDVCDFKPVSFNDIMLLKQKQ